MPDEEKDSGWKETLLGFGVILLFVVGAIFTIRTVYTKYFLPAPGVVSLSAYFVDDLGIPVPTDAPNSAKSHIRVKGDISQGGQLIKNGSVSLTISSASNALFRQSVYIPFQSGHFETDDPAFRSVRPGEPIEIKAEVTAPGVNETATIYLNHKPPVESPVSTTVLGWGLLMTVLFLVVVFFVAFTGKKTPFKNRVAIMFSYLIIAIFLAVPIVAPTFLLRTYPSAYSDMIGAPAGLVNTHTPDQPVGGTQWALNIGGYSVIAPKPALVPSNPIPSNNDNKVAPDSTGKKPTVTPGSAGPAAGAAETQGGNSMSSITIPPSLTTTTTSDETANPATSTPQGEGDTPVVQVTGGLLIPLYVIILSVIGGAINMTRKVPGFQKEGEESDFSLARPIAMVGTAVLNRIMSTATPTTTAASSTPSSAVPPPTPAEPEKAVTSLEQQAKVIDDQLGPLVTTQLQRNSESDATLAQIQALVSKMQDVYSSRKSNEPLLKFASFEDWAASHPRLRELLRGGWRVELLNQYMYLISAPFLAIVTYYILDLLGLSKQGVVVVLSFSVGLVSERIVSWILGIATGYLRTDTGNPAPKAA
jgi:hypothetical protein